MFLNKQKQESYIQKSLTLGGVNLEMNNKTIIFALIAIFVLLGSAIAVSALNTNFPSNLTALAGTTIKFERGSDDPGTENNTSGSDDRLISTRTGLMHYNELTQEQKDKLKSLTKDQLEVLIKARLSAAGLEHMSGIAKERLKKLGLLEDHLLSRLSEKKEHLDKLGELKEEQLKELNNFTRAKVKAMIEEHSSAQLKNFDFTKERMMDEQFMHENLTARIVKNPRELEDHMNQVETEINVSTEAEAQAGTEFHAAKTEWNNCKNQDQNSTECQQKLAAFKQRTIDWLAKTVDNLLAKLDKIETRVKASEKISDEEETKTIAEINAVASVLEKAKAEIALLDSNSSGEAIAAQAKIVRDAWIKVQLLDKRINGELVGRHAGEIIVQAEQLEQKLNDLLNRLDDQNKSIDGLNALVDEFSQHILDAKTHYNNAKAFWTQIDGVLGHDTNSSTDTNTTVPELVKQAHAELRLAHQALKDAHQTLKEIYKLVKDNKQELRDNQEPFFQPGKELGYFIWQGENNTVNICWNSDGEQHSVEGKISSANGFCNVKPRLFEFSTDKYSIDANNTAAFSAQIKPHMDCLQIKTQASSLNFDLKMDGSPAAKIFLTKNKTLQTTNPFDWSITPAKECKIKETIESCPTNPSAGVQLEVCGADGKTYDSACEASKAGIEVAYEMACGSCNPESGEVCGSDNETYSSECGLPTGITKASTGACAITHVAVEEGDN